MKTDLKEKREDTGSRSGKESTGSGSRSGRESAGSALRSGKEFTGSGLRSGKRSAASESKFFGKNNDLGVRANKKINDFSINAGGKIEDFSSRAGEKFEVFSNRASESFTVGRAKIRKPVTKLLFSRIVFLTLLTFLQFIIWFVVFDKLGDKYKYFLEASSILSVLVIIWIINSWSDPAYKISWALIVAAVPVMGTFLYLYTHLNLDGRKNFERLNDLIEETSQYAVTARPVKDRLKKLEPDFHKMAHYMESVGKAPVYENTEIRHYSVGDDAFDDICAALEKAESFIFMEFFIIEEGVMLDPILDILEKKSKQGVEVRFMYDDLGSADKVPIRYWKELEKRGINAQTFSKLKLFFSTTYNNRDHRKILVVDGKVAFSGGINLADEYINAVERFGHWKDNVFRVEGDAVRSFTMMFLQMWNVQARRKDKKRDFERYLTIESDRLPDIENDGFIIPYGDGPHKQDNVAENVYLDIINNANRFVSIMTPYVVPDNEVLHALKHASKSGVEVSIIVPGIPDKKAVNILTKSYYPELLRSGVHIYEYDPGFVHSKMMVADGMIAVEGTVNLDYRSLYLHYECGCIIYKNKVIGDIVDDFEATRELCHEVTMEEFQSYGSLFRWTASILRIFAPMM